jgi:UTP:GlnB (protein PII) uridylyltransferase
MREESSTQIEIETGEDPYQVFLYLKTKDRPGILFMTTQILYLLDYDIIRFDAITDQGIAQDDFVIRKNRGGPISEQDRKQLISVLRSNL